MERRARYPQEMRERAVRMVFEHQDEYGSQWAAITSVATKLGMTLDTLRKWVRRLGLRGITRGKACTTTKPGTSSLQPTDRVNRQFIAATPNRSWTADLTC